VLVGVGQAVPLGLTSGVFVAVLLGVCVILNLVILIF
jgi:hypothetical protein